MKHPLPILLPFLIYLSPILAQPDTILTPMPDETVGYLQVSCDSSGLDIYVDNVKVKPEFVETELKRRLKDVEQPTIILRAEKSVPIDNAVNIMDIANQNSYKVILAVRPK